MLASLNHPHIAQVHGFEEIGTTWGRSCSSSWKARNLHSASRAGAMPTDEALPIARQIADAIEVAREDRHGPSRSEAGQHHGAARRRT